MGTFLLVVDITMCYDLLNFLEGKMDKVDWHGMADEFGQKVYEIVVSEEKKNGFCRISISRLMEMVDVKNRMHEDMFRRGVRKYLAQTREEDEYTLITFEKFAVEKAKENIRLFEEVLRKAEILHNKLINASPLEHLKIRENADGLRP